MSKAAAWVMKVDETLYTSVSQTELVHIINKPVLFNIPGTPEYCQNVIIWNDNILPVVDISCLRDKNAQHTSREVVAVIIYRDKNNNICYGGINLVGSPDLELVENTQMCDFPTQYKDLHEISLSCFKNKSGHEVPILNMSMIFSRDYSERIIR